MSIEIKSLNSRQSDISIRVPSLFKEKELEIKNEISRLLDRGKIDCYISLEITAEEAAYRINKEIVNNYIRQLKEISEEHQLDPTDSLIEAAMKLPESLKSVKDELEEKDWKIILDTLHQALEKVIDYRRREGNELEQDIRSRIIMIIDKQKKIPAFEKTRIDTIRNRIHQNLNDLRLEESYNPNRFEQELIYYLDKLDITEEQVRLNTHCNYFLEVMSAPEPAGRKLGFIAQEIGREINTLGAKANETNIQKLVVEMKDELEKIKEQLNNVL
ncbi:MAG: hypothetical protein AMS27_13195 [Bacteroides sp. SM23_62_1]|nr:MAG: hypothetical protein AMS27_13195 [Bacteroides sp. SM23_62_1]